MARENTIRSKIIKYINALPNGCAEAVHGSNTQRFRPDINACINGKTYRIEVKSKEHDNTPTEGQKQNLLKWKKAGAITLVAYTLEDVISIINEV